ncbi:MAG TPA: acylneuraminate cytidylyltransferase family protein [Candidatus Dojkabacteria bacterium]|nr:acylneuraminate cytidylyltransferase family protein [Candidatus Dojkabacteria bacterium]
MNILGIIPARGGSKGIPGKNIKSLLGKPLIGYTIEAALHSDINKIIVSTDDLEIKRVAEEFGAEVPFIRNEELSNDTAKSIDVAIDALTKMENSLNVTFDAIMLLQPTTPFRSTTDINVCIKLLEENKDADSVISVVDVKAHHPARMKYLRDGILIDPQFCEAYENQNRQELESMYIRNGAIYLTKRETILKKSYKGNKCLAYVMPEETSINIDTLTDFEYAEWIHSKKIS